MSTALLSIENLSAWRGATQVLQGINLQIATGERVTLVGDNGAGKSSLLLAIAGHLRCTGKMLFDGHDIAVLAAHRRARSGIGFCPEGRRVFAAMTVAENLAVAGRDGEAGEIARSVYRLFPELERRKSLLGWQLSGGEQQMLALGRALMGKPRLLLLDEPFLGLAPDATARLQHALIAVSGNGISLLLAEQDLERAKSLCDRLIFLDRGRIAL
jgi:branched-chain amino acid transport system ATP-binding protein